MKEQTLLKVMFRDENNLERPTLIVCENKQEVDTAMEVIFLAMEDLLIMDAVFDTLHDGTIKAKSVTNVIGVML